MSLDLTIRQSAITEISAKHRLHKTLAAFLFCLLFMPFILSWLIPIDIGSLKILANMMALTFPAINNWAKASDFPEVTALYFSLAYLVLPVQIVLYSLCMVCIPAIHSFLGAQKLRSLLVAVGLLFGVSLPLFSGPMSRPTQIDSITTFIEFVTTSSKLGLGAVFSLMHIGCALGIGGYLSYIFSPFLSRTRD